MRKPVLYRHKAVQRPRLPPLVLVVVTATEKAWMLEKLAGGLFVLFFIVTFSPMMLYSGSHSICRAKGSMECEWSSFPKPVCPLNLLIQTKYIAFAKSSWLLVCDWHPLLLLSCRFLQLCHLRRGAHSGPLPWDAMRIPSPKIEVSSSPSNSSALPGICRFHFALLHGGHTHSSSTHSCTEMICTLLRDAPDGYCQVLQGDCIADL